MFSTQSLLHNPDTLTHILTPVKAVPAMNHAKGSRYQGDTLIRYRLAATLLRVMAMALHAFRGLI